MAGSALYWITRTTDLISRFEARQDLYSDTHLPCLRASKAIQRDQPNHAQPNNQLGLKLAGTNTLTFNRSICKCQILIKKTDPIVLNQTIRVV